MYIHASLLWLQGDIDSYVGDNRHAFACLPDQLQLELEKVIKNKHFFHL